MTISTRPNKFPGTCSGCRLHVGANEGFTAANPAWAPGNGTKWLVYCPRCNANGGEAPAEAETQQYPPTDEQQYAIECALSGQTIALEAGAGAGKTSTLVFIAKALGGFGTFLAFNKNIVRDVMGKLPRNVAAHTTHSLAFKAVGYKLDHRMNPKTTRRESGDAIAKRLGIAPITVKVPDLISGGITTKTLAPKMLYNYVLDTIGYFCNSADDEPAIHHFAYIDGIDTPENGFRTRTNNDIVRVEMEPWLKTVWADLSDPKGQLPYRSGAGHAYYLKLWQLSDPVVPGAFILFDEAQDAAPVQVAIVAAQKVQTIWVGDSEQAIYSWRGAVNALQNVPVEETAFLTKSFRFGPGIAEVANDILNTIFGSRLRLEGLGPPSTLGSSSKPDCILTRTNAGAIGVVLGEMQKGRNVHLIGGGGEVAAFARAAIELQTKGETEYPDLCAFESWDQVRAYVKADSEGSDIKLLVKLIDDFGAREVLRAVGNTCTEFNADVVVSTAHKSKGREWDAVRLHGDFPVDPDDDGEKRLLYVAATRARKELDYSGCGALLRVRGEDGS